MAPSPNTYPNPSPPITTPECTSTRFPRRAPGYSVTRGCSTAILSHAGAAAHKAKRLDLVFPARSARPLRSRRKGRCLHSPPSRALRDDRRGVDLSMRARLSRQQPRRRLRESEFGLRGFDDGLSLDPRARLGEHAARLGIRRAIPIPRRIKINQRLSAPACSGLATPEIGKQRLSFEPWLPDIARVPQRCGSFCLSYILCSANRPAVDSTGRCRQQRRFEMAIKTDRQAFRRRAASSIACAPTATGPDARGCNLRSRA